MVARKARKIHCFSKGHENVQQSCCSIFNVEYTTYQFCLSDGSHKWTIQKRYSDFDVLDRELQTAYPKRMLKVDRLPAKATFGSMSPSRIISREKSFDAYLKQLLKDAELVVSPELREFLEIPLEAAISDDEGEAANNSDGSKSDPSDSLSAALTTPGSSGRMLSWQAEAEAKWGEGRLSVQ
ncbi:hypothetical protein GUITHDRAFT_118313 [Guillardia theta CCMP2712]|uniref:PX domain-containing protein n=2 Tax=Guillardia theta TaxID=55529 RepID=L1IHD3_GUITC|nr:hypothetical protein GUITHDRAFT_118313 [Guillardia theta CCMP2712]EKX35502.1 hypothetical protein GUITHDRAFT_118313 [Guillardia theta CCMP2712]|mmetsp:Transcript_273/g.595  ORF Transcript_273/g.595 Transcript_273/m.595 type:complete len:182 (+) Transcript_273:206-751(+)|eukprot:XP_005822482.1 hypothetical protein GUITHDRAFT_118313 [Guillardia theta CCMP2712]